MAIPLIIDTDPGVDDAFAIALCGTVDVGSGEVALSSAGHEPAVLLHADGRRDLVEVPTAPPLGIEVAGHYPLWRGRLQPGDALVAYTDGITEAFDGERQAFGADRLLTALIPGLDARVLCESLVAATHDFVSGAAQSDDITVLALSFGPSGQGDG